MTGPEHYKEAERVLEGTCKYLREYLTDDSTEVAAELLIAQHAAHVAVAQVHATLALAAATGLGVSMARSDAAEWYDAASSVRLGSAP